MVAPLINAGVMLYEIEGESEETVVNSGDDHSIKEAEWDVMGEILAFLSHSGYYVKVNVGEGKNDGDEEEAPGTERDE